VFKVVSYVLGFAMLIAGFVINRQATADLSPSLAGNIMGGTTLVALGVLIAKGSI